MVHGAMPNLGMSAKKWCMEKRVASGYEKKARADEENLLNKEKQKEKKHKKEKKDREKREGKEKNEKDRSEEKHKEKKERKDKHKDKKDKHKDKERKSVLAEKDTARAQEHDIAKKVGPSSVQSAQSSDTKILLELGKRIGNDDGRSAEKNLLVHKFTLTGPGNHDKRSKDNGEDQRKVSGRQNGLVAATGFIQKFEGVHRGTLEEVGGLVEKSLMAENGFVQKFEGEHRGTLEGVGGVVEKSVEKPMEHEENNKQNNGESSGGEQKERDHGKKIRVGLLVEKLIEKRTEQEESNKQKNGESRAGKHKDKDPERKSKLKDKKRDKEKEKEERKEKKKEKRKEKELKKEQLKQRESRKPAAGGDNMKTSSDLLKERSQQSGGEGNVGKRKELETNGFLHDAGIRPSKLARPASSTHQIVENGRITEPCKTAIRFVEDLEGNKKISSSPSVPGNEKILEPSPRTISSTHQLIVNGRKPEPSKTAIRTVAEFGDGNKKVTPSLSVATNGKVTKPCPRPKPDVFTKELMENGSELEPGKAAGHVEAEGEGNSKKVLSSISVAGTGSKMEPPTPSLPAPENGRKIELSRSSDQSTSVRNMVVDNHKVGSKEIMVNCKEAVAQQPNVRLKRHSLSLKQVKEKVKPKPPHPDSKLLDSIFSVPKVERSDFDDQEWLFGSSDLQQAKRPKVGSSQVEETTKQQVWAEALCLESADIIALPYVIPY